MDVRAGGGEKYDIGVDFGTLSGRAVVVRVSDGKELRTGVYDYSHAVVTDALQADLAGDGAARLPGEWALQVPNDYRNPFSLEVALGRIGRVQTNFRGVNSGSHYLP